MGAAAAVGHMTIPSLAGFVIARLGYDAMMALLCALNFVGFVLTTIVVLHLRANFTPLGFSPNSNSPECVPLHPAEAGAAKRWADTDDGGGEREGGNGVAHRRHDCDRDEAVAV